LLLFIEYNLAANYFIIRLTNFFINLNITNRKMKKTIFALIFAMMLGFSVSSCNGCGAGTATDADSTKVDTVLVDSTAVDSVVADTIAVDTTVVAE
jgi:hypothetical protein